MDQIVAKVLYINLSMNIFNDMNFDTDHKDILREFSTILPSVK